MMAEKAIRAAPLEASAADAAERAGEPLCDVGLRTPQAPGTASSTHKSDCGPDFALRPFSLYIPFNYYPARGQSNIIWHFRDPYQKLVEFHRVPRHRLGLRIDAPRS